MVFKTEVILIFQEHFLLLTLWEGSWDWLRVRHCGIWLGLRLKRGSLQQSDCTKSNKVVTVVAGRLIMAVPSADIFTLCRMDSYREGWLGSHGWAVGPDFIPSILGI